MCSVAVAVAVADAALSSVHAAQLTLELAKLVNSGAMLTDDSAGSTTELGDEDHSVSGDSLSEWRACDQVDNDSPSTSPPFWDTDGEDDDPGAQIRSLSNVMFIIIS